MKIGLFAKPGRTPRLLLERINAFQPGSGHFFDLSSGVSSLALHADRIVLDGIELTQLDCLWLHGFSYSNPTIPAAAEQCDWSVWHDDYLATQQEYSCYYSLFEELDRRGILLINPPRVHLDQFMKFAWLERLRDSGFQVPALLCSNDPRSIDEFCQGRETILWRPVTGRAAWQRFTAKQRAVLVDPAKSPIIVAEAIPGPLTRVYLFAGKPILSLQHQAPAHLPPMERLEQFSSVACPDHYAAILQNLAQTLGVGWAVVTCVSTPTALWIYDLDPDPILEWLPSTFYDFLLTSLAEELTGRGSQEAEPLLNQDRPTMFLRRMLNILFQMESSKYEESGSA